MYSERLYTLNIVNKVRDVGTFMHIKAVFSMSRI